MLDHISFSVLDYEVSLNFYDQTLAILGVVRLVTLDFGECKTAGYGAANSIRPNFWISPNGLSNENIGQAKGFHLAFIAPNIDSVNAWYQKALSLGAQDNGSPGLRQHYHAGYYGAFVIDPNGWRIEACIHNYSITHST